MKNKTLTMNSTSNYTYNNRRRKFRVDYETCNECNLGQIEECCNKCGEGVCIEQKCCETFPHYHDTLFTICRRCATEIEKKFYILEVEEVNQSELKLLKQKIKKRMMKKTKQLERLENTIRK